MGVLAINKRANFDYEIISTYEAGLVLFGHEVKSIKNGSMSLKGAFVVLRTSTDRPSLYLINAHVPLYKAASQLKDIYAPERPRQLLLKKKEINYLLGKYKEKGLTLVPLKIYTKNNLIKLEFGLGRGRKKYDKREVIKKREVDRSIRTLTKQRVR